MISIELAQGIRHYDRAIRQLGGYGARIRATMPDGEVREGVLIELGFGGCQPGLQTADGKRYGVSLTTACALCALAQIHREYDTGGIRPVDNGAGVQSDVSPRWPRRPWDLPVASRKFARRITSLY
jgi:hypothetical protein